MMKGRFCSLREEKETEMKVRIVNRVNAFNIVRLFVTFCRFSLQMKAERHLLHKGPIELMRQMLAGRSVVAFVGWRIVCHVTVWHLTGNWYECGTMWTDPDFREQRLADRVMRNLIENNSQKLMMLTSTNKVSQRLARAVGFHNVLFSSLPSEVHRETCICGVEKTGPKGPMECQIKDGKCVCFVQN